MGAYSPLPDLDDTAVDAAVEAVHLPILAEMARRGIPFRGFLYAGLMLTRRGPVLLETNVRLGDPEAQAILPRLDAPLAPLLLAAARGALPDEIARRLAVRDAATVAIVLAAGGYPGDPRRGDPISGLEAAAAQGALVFHAGTFGRPQGGFGTNGGRVLTVVGRGPTLEAARDAAERAADSIDWDGQQRRHDIASDLPVPAGVGA
jgi:phosphoribosylamine--glycine ligase